MKKLSVILLLVLAGIWSVSAGDFSLSLKGSTSKNRINVGKKTGLSFRKEQNRQTTTLTFKTNKAFIEGKAVLKVKKGDVFAVSVAGDFLRNDDAKKQYYRWIEVEKLKINDQVLIGEGSKTNPNPLNVSKAKELLPKIKVRSNSELVIEIKYRETPKPDADALSEKEGTSDFKKSQKAKRDRQEKRRKERKNKDKAESEEAAAGGAKAPAGAPAGAPAADDSDKE